MKTAKTCIPKLWQQRSNYVDRQPIKTAKTCTPNRYALVRLGITNDDLGTSWALPGDNLGMTWG